MENIARLMSAKEVCTYLGLGRNRGVEFAKSIGAEVPIGRRRLYDKHHKQARFRYSLI